MRPPTAVLRCPAGSWERATATPHARLRPGVLAYRGFRLRLDAPRRRLEAPVGAVTLLLGFGGPLRLRRAGRAPVVRTSGLSGLHTAPVLGEHDGHLAGIEVLIAPWAAFTLFGISQYELADRVADPADALPRTLGAPLGRRARCTAADLAGALAALPTWNARFTLLDEVLLHWSATGPPCSARTVRAWSELVRTGGTVPVRRLADEVGWSVRQLESRFREQIGLSPKAAARVLRTQRARRLLLAGYSQAQTAAACGFYDQSHLSGDFRALTGCTPGEFTAARSGATALTATGSPTEPDRLVGEATTLILPPGRAAAFSRTGRLR
ncbi:helix-turn-helix transcriptional regulator [Streptomyces boluensis]|uniref:Helix-turn-helix domain-containing protein n=1 Tax=Streptomyces boluensis TaxID=1775135 RepID=A0A964XNT9_9ACTN|nr:helix-turn-helix transcriptional regulator [Streptomyces boluensis]NBE53933.1 helix-turn-helix domain-containing protein [Streptomyces boluensis]